jgi:hypothetical protein
VPLIFHRIVLDLRFSSLLSFLAESPPDPPIPAILRSRVWARTRIFLCRVVFVSQVSVLQAPGCSSTCGHGVGVCLSRGDLPVLLVVPVVIFILVLWLQPLLSCRQSSAFHYSQPEQHAARSRSSYWPSASTECVSSLLLTGPFPLYTIGTRFSSARPVCYSWCRL